MLVLFHVVIIDLNKYYLLQPIIVQLFIICD